MNHEKYIQRCLQIAKNGIGFTRPNPSVGTVIVLNDKIIGEGFTSPYGQNHAEVNAINSVKNKLSLKEATIYVTLEPCSHYGKTPPCADLIIKHQFKEVVIGCLDPNELVAGKGVEKLRNESINVIVGVLEKECLTHHKRFLKTQNKQQPYIVLKWAETNNGFIAPKTKKEQQPVWISNAFSQQLVHKWRGQEHAILVGTNTVIADNPSLTVRDWSGVNPIRIVLDRTLRVFKDANVFKGDVKTIVFTEKGKSKEGNIVFEKIDFSKNVAKQICDVLQEHQIQSLIVEGGAKTLQLFIDENLWDEARIFKGGVAFLKGIKAPVVSGKLLSEKVIQNDVLKIVAND